MDSKGKLKKLKNVNNEDVIKRIMEENMDVRGGYKKESVYDTLIWHTIIFPVTVYRYIAWYGKYFSQFFEFYWLKLTYPVQFFYELAHFQPFLIFSPVFRRIFEFS